MRFLQEQRERLRLHHTKRSYSHADPGAQMVTIPTPDFPQRFTWVFDFDEVYFALTSGQCLEPIITSGDTLVVTPEGKPQKGELVTFYHPAEKNMVVKRFLGEKPEGLHMVQDNPCGHFFMPNNTVMHRVIAIIPQAEAPTPPKA